MRWLSVLCLFLTAFCLGSESEPRLHLGAYASGGYIGIWKLGDDLYVKKEWNEFQDDDGFDKSSYRVEYLSGGHDMRGVGGSVGAAVTYDLNSWLALRGNLYLSIRNRFVNAKEHHYKVTKAYEDDQVFSYDSTYGSRGQYDISLTYWHLDMPLGLRLNLPYCFYVETGALVSYIVATNLKMSLLSIDMNTYSAGVELGLLGSIGRGFTIKNRRLDVFGKFTLGMTPLLNDSVRDFICQRVHLREWIVEMGVIYWLF